VSPTKEEIEQRAAEIRATWSEEEERSRNRGAVPYSMPCVHDPFYEERDWDDDDGDDTYRPDS
jgi:hypothetical protein